MENNKKHASVRIGDWKIPLIGIDPEATSYICDLCGKRVEIEEIKINESGNQFLCKRCRE